MVVPFDYSLDFENINFRAHPELYRIGRGEQGVLLVEPYKSEILPHWRFKTAPIATASSEKIYNLFLQYKKDEDFVGMDMARKFLQMGYTRARRYANHSSGKKFAVNSKREGSKEKSLKVRKQVLPQASDWKTNEKAEAARIFYAKYILARTDPEYQLLKERYKAQYEIPRDGSV